MKNGTNNHEFFDQVFDPDFFQKLKLSRFSDLEIAQSIDEFFGSNFIYGPLYNQMAIIEIKLDIKKIYRGTLSRFLGIDTIFPLVNTQAESLVINKDEDNITICCIARVTGQVVNSFLMCENFNPEKFRVNVNEIKLGSYNFSIISGFLYEDALFKNLKSDFVIRNQWGFYF